MKVLVTGAFGNIGRSTVQALLEHGHTVRCLDLPRRSSQKLAQKLPPGVELHWGDLRDRETVEWAVAGVQAVIHLAFIIPKLSSTGQESESHPEWAESINVGGTRRVIAAARMQPNPPSLLFASSVHVYGRTQHLAPPLTLDLEPQPVEHYARHKLACEQMVRESGLRWAILRLAASIPIAVRPDPGMFDVPLENRIEYVHTRDVGEAFARALEHPDVWGRTLLIGGGERCQFIYRDFVAQVLDGMGVGMLPERAFGHTPFACDYFDSSESQALLGYQQRTLDDYIADMRVCLGWRVEAARMFRPLVQAYLLQHSPYWRERAKKP